MIEIYFVELISWGNQHTENMKFRDIHSNLYNNTGKAVPVHMDELDWNFELNSKDISPFIYENINYCTTFKFVNRAIYY